MKKKIAMFLCVITCLACFAGCGEKTYTQVEESKVQQCAAISEMLISVADSLATPDVLSKLTSDFRKHETPAYILGNQVDAEYGAIEGMLTSYLQAKEDMGGVVNAGKYTYDLNKNEIMLAYELFGPKANGTFTFKYSNDIFTKLISADAQAKLSVGDNLKKAGKSMGTAGLNTLLGMGTVFVVLILISLIISGFSLFNRPNKPAPVKEVKDNEDQAAPAIELSDDLELVAVITAAIRAYEGNSTSSSADGFVVRSIRRANRRND